MLHISENAKVFIMCPAFGYTGGIECLYTLASEVQKYRECYIYLVKNYGANKMHTNDAYANYNCKVITSIPHKERKKENILIVPEIYTHLIISEMTAGIYWLSVDNYRDIKDSTKYSFIKDKGKYFHLVQSAYAYLYLKKHGERNIIKCTDYISSDYLEHYEEMQKRENIVLYNPKKGYDFTKKLIQYSPNISFVPIQNMKKEEIIDLMRKSKVYIDFGNFPGRDRIPREAVSQGLCIITGKQGASHNKYDVPISNEFKISANKWNLPKIKEKIQLCLSDYDTQIIKFEKYRQAVHNEPKVFRMCIKKIFEN